MSSHQKDMPLVPATRAENILIDRVREILLLLSKTISSIKVFSWQHAATQKMIRAAWESLTRFLENEPRLAIGVEEFAFTYRDRVVYRDEKAIKSLPFLLYKDGMKQLFFYKSLKEEELVEFLKIVRDAFEMPAEESDIVGLLWEKDLAHIHCYAPDDFLEAKIGSGKQPAMMYADPSELRMGHIALSPDDARVEAAAAEDVFNLTRSLEADSPAASAPVENTAQGAAGEGESFTLLSDQEDHRLREMLQINRRLSPTGEIVLLAGELLHLEANPTRFLQIMEVVDRLHQDLIDKADFFWAAQLLERVLELKAGFASPASFQRDPLQDFQNKVMSRISLAAVRQAVIENRLPDFHPLFDYLSLIGLETLPLVIDLCESLKNPALYEAMSGYLREVGRHSPSRLLQLASASRPALTKEVIAALGSHPDKRVVLLLAAFKGSWDRSIKQEAIKALGRSSDAGAVRILADFLRDPDEDIRVFTANNIRSLSDKALGDYVTGLVQSKKFYKMSPVERQAFLDLLGRQKNRETYGLLKDILGRRSGLKNRNKRLAARLAVVQTLARVGGPLSRELLEDGCRMRGRKIRQACRIALQNLLRESPAKTPPPEKTDGPA
jgi:hypothetical protein